MRRIGSEGGGRSGLQPLVPEELKADVGKLGKRIKNMNAWLLDPKSKFMQTWDFFTLSALFFTLTVTPFEARAPHRTAPRRAAPHRTAPHRTAPRRAAPRRAASPLMTISVGPTWHGVRGSRWRCWRPNSIGCLSSIGWSTSSSSATWSST